MANFNTSRDFFTAIINGTAITTEMVEYAKSAIEKMDTKNEKKRATLSKLQVANEGIKSDILAFMGENGSQSAKSLADNFGVSTQKITALMNQLVKSGNVTVVKDKFEGSSTKVNVYSLVTSD
jgi:predicted HTH transcriptional regulator